MTLKIFDLTGRFFFSPQHGRLFFAIDWKKTNSCAETRKTLNFRVSTFSVPSGSRADLHARPEGPSLRMGWDGWDGWNIKSVLQISLYFVGIQNMYMSLVRTLVRDIGVQSVPLIENQIPTFWQKNEVFFCFGLSSQIKIIS